MTILKETKSKFAIRQVAQGTVYFNILHAKAWPKAIGMLKGQRNNHYNLLGR